MNARTRLKRRILREHRRGKTFHVCRDWSMRGLRVYDFWSCPHCPPRPVNTLIPLTVPRAYR